VSEKLRTTVKDRQTWGHEKLRTHFLIQSSLALCETVDIAASNNKI